MATPAHDELEAYSAMSALGLRYFYRSQLNRSTYARRRLGIAGVLALAVIASLLLAEELSTQGAFASDRNDVRDAAALISARSPGKRLGQGLLTKVKQGAQAVSKALSAAVAQSGPGQSAAALIAPAAPPSSGDVDPVTVADLLAPLASIENLDVVNGDAGAGANVAPETELRVTIPVILDREVRGGSVSAEGGGSGGSSGGAGAPSTGGAGLPGTGGGISSPPMPISRPTAIPIAPPASAIPEPGAWLMMILGYLFIGLCLRHRTPGAKTIRA